MFICIAGISPANCVDSDSWWCWWWRGVTFTGDVVARTACQWLVLTGPQVWPSSSPPLHSPPGLAVVSVSSNNITINTDRKISFITALMLTLTVITVVCTAWQWCLWCSPAGCSMRQLSSGPEWVWEGRVRNCEVADTTPLSLPHTNMHTSSSHSNLAVRYPEIRQMREY